MVGQDEALRVVSDAVRVARAGLQSAERPLGAFLLVGPTGVGKTQLTKALAEFLCASAASVPVPPTRSAKKRDREDAVLPP